MASSQHDASDCQTDIPEPHGSNGGIVHQFQLCRKSCCSELAQKVHAIDLICNEPRDRFLEDYFFIFDTLSIVIYSLNALDFTY